LSFLRIFFAVSAIVEYDYTAKESDELTLKRGATITNIKIQPGGWWEGTLMSTGRTGMFPDNFVRVLEPDDKNPVVLRDKTAAQNRRCKVIYSYQENKPDELTLAVGDIVEIFEEVEEGWWKGKLKGKIGVFPSNFVEVMESASPMSANRTSSVSAKPTLLMDGHGAVSGGVAVLPTGHTGSLSKTNSLNKSRSSLNSSRENLDDVIPNQQQILPHDAPSLPPKPVRELCKVLFAYAPANEDELRLVEGDIITILSKELPDKGWWKGELKGRVGVFPDNFVSLMPPEVSPVKDSFHAKPERPPLSNKVLIGKQNNNQTGGTTNSFASRKESFGSKDSLNEHNNTSNNTGSPTVGNVAAHRRSLETRNTENHHPSTNNTQQQQVTEKPPRKSLDSSKTSEIRKSLENLDDKKATPPPVLGKKPQVPIKKSPSITSVTGNLFGFNKKGKSGGEGKVQDGTDGVGSSKMKSEVADNNEKNVSGERLSREESEFGIVERGSVLKDMRVNRAKAPKRRPPTSAGSLMGESGNGTNGLSNGNTGLFHQLSQGAEPESPKPDLNPPGFLKELLLRFIRVFLGFLQEFLLGFLQKFILGFLQEFLLGFLKEVLLGFLREFHPEFLLGFIQEFLPGFIQEFLPRFQDLLLGFLHELLLGFLHVFFLGFLQQFLLGFLQEFLLGFLQKFLLGFPHEFFLGFLQEFLLEFLQEFLLGFLKEFLLGFLQDFLLGFLQDFLLGFLQEFLLGFLQEFLLGFLKEFLL
ncbi:hypothetical protein RP20_CCG001092, partial [Aedes albopictus]